MSLAAYPVMAARGENYAVSWPGRRGGSRGREGRRGGGGGGRGRKGGGEDRGVKNEDMEGFRG